ncbi:MAG: HAMP domain-containing sensor histidine kinase [Kofleriaceae bacterium]
MTSLRSRLLVGTALAVTVAIAAIAAVVITSTRATLLEQFDNTLESDVRAIATQVEQDGDEIGVEFDPKTLEPGEQYAVWEGNKWLAGGTEDSPQPAPARTITPGLSSTTASHVETIGDPAPLDGPPVDSVVSLGGKRQVTLHTFARQQPGEHDPKVPVIVAFARPTASVDAAIAHVTFVSIAAGIGGVLLSLLLLLASVQSGLRPIRELASAIAAIRAADLATQLTSPGTPAELLPITSRLDELLARVEAAFSRERELTAEVAHELRTPLSGLRATIELALDRDRAGEKYKTALEQCLSITLTTQRVVESLLSLARLDAGQTPVTVAPVDLDELVRQGLEAVAPRAAERAIQIVTELEPVTVNTDPEKLRVIVANLVENAVTYTDQGGEIRATLLGGTLRIANTGCHLAPDQIKRVFERFWRGDPSREPGGHVGIGLALSKKLTELVGGNLEVSVHDQRFTATVTL